MVDSSSKKQGLVSLKWWHSKKVDGMMISLFSMDELMNFFVFFSFFSRNAFDNPK